MRIAVIGAGPGGYVAAIKASQLGADVTVIESDEVGGTCLNRGCIPTKTLIASTQLLYKIRSAEEYGITINGEVLCNIKGLLERKNRVVSTLVKGIKSLFKSRKVNLIKGTGTLITERRIEVRKSDGTVDYFDVDKIIIATGSRPANIPGFFFDGERILSSDDIWRMETTPKNMVIIGAGVIGCEIAFIFRELGTDITMIEMMPRVLFTEDEDMSMIIERELKKRKINLYTSTSVESLNTKDGSIFLRLTNGKEISTEKVLVSVGRTFNTDRLGLENMGIEMGARGEIRVGFRMETNIKCIYACGDVTGGMLLAHKASKEGIVAAMNACGIDSEMDYSLIPTAIFTSPEIGSIGLREFQAREKGIDVVTGVFQYRSLGKAHAMGEITGIFKVVADARTDKVLGVHIAGAHASDIIHEASLAIKYGLRVKDFADMIHAHPTLSEGLMEAMEDVHNEAIHVAGK